MSWRNYFENSVKQSMKFLLVILNSRWKLWHTWWSRRSSRVFWQDGLCHLKYQRASSAKISGEIYTGDSKRSRKRNNLYLDCSLWGGVTWDGLKITEHRWLRYDSQRRLLMKKQTTWFVEWHFTGIAEIILKLFVCFERNIRTDEELIAHIRLGEYCTETTTQPKSIGSGVITEWR